MKTQTIEVKLRDGVMGAYLAVPDRAPAGAIIAIMEIWGVNDTMRAHAHEFAQAGYFWFHPPAFHFASGQISGTSLPLWVQGSTVQSSLVLRSLITAVLCGPSVNRNRNAGAAIV